MFRLNNAAATTVLIFERVPLVNTFSFQRKHCQLVRVYVRIHEVYTLFRSMAGVRANYTLLDLGRLLHSTYLYSHLLSFLKTFRHKWNKTLTNLAYENLCFNVCSCPFCFMVSSRRMKCLCYSKSLNVCGLLVKQNSLHLLQTNQIYALFWGRERFIVIASVAFFYVYIYIFI